MAWLRLLWVAFVWQLSQGNDSDSLLDWQGKLWSEDPDMLFLSVKNSDLGVGCYSYSGDTSRVSPPDQSQHGYEKPLEFTWRLPDPKKDNKAPKPDVVGMGWEQQGVMGLTASVVSKDVYVMEPRAKALKGVALTVRRLDGRWVALMRLNGVVVAAHYWYADVITFAGIPRGVRSITMHGYHIKNCSIDYTQKEQVLFQEGDEWELMYGEDPACECEPNPTCAKRGLQGGGMACGELIPPMLKEEVLSQHSFTQFVDSIEKFREELQVTREWYNDRDLVNETCNHLPSLLDPSDRTVNLFKSCMSSFVHDMAVAHFSMMTGAVVLTAKSHMSQMQVKQAIRIIGEPRDTYMRCMENQHKILDLERKQEYMLYDVENLQDHLHNAIAQHSKHADHTQEEEEFVRTALAFSVCSNIFFFAVLCCLYCCRQKLARALQASLASPEASIELRAV